MIRRRIRHGRVPSTTTSTNTIHKVLFILLPFLASLYALILLTEIVTEPIHNDGFTLSLEDAQLPTAQTKTMEKMIDESMLDMVAITSHEDPLQDVESGLTPGRDSGTDRVTLLKSDTFPWSEMKSVQLRASHPSNIASLDAHNPVFQRYDGVVITTKVHWAESIGALKRMLCLITAAYNRFVNYDIVVFTTIPWTDEQVLDLARFTAPAKLTVALDGPSLKEQLAAMTKEEVAFLEKRCAVKTGENLTWFHHCVEEDSGTKANLAYSWQSEFRAYHIWKHEALNKYKWMIWMDSDALCTKTWDKDPMKVMIENNLTVMYDNFPAGSTKGLDLKEKMMQAYGRAICGIWETDDGIWKTRDCREKDVAWVTQIHGFHHITNLDLYRSDKHTKWLKNMVGDYRFSRKWDDQLGVTVPAAFEAPERVWDLRKHNMTWMIRHNGQYDGRGNYTKVRNPKRWWQSEGRIKWKAAKLLCDQCLCPEGGCHEK